jgi:DNA-nicking Smr family endonuclease
MVKKLLNDDDITIWKKITETVTPILKERLAEPTDQFENEITPLKNKNIKSEKTKKGSLSSQKQHPTIPSPNKLALRPADLDSVGYGGISRGDARSMKSGQSGYTRKVDLHGYNREQAKIMLCQFLQASSRHGHRHVLVITGKGTAGKGVIRSCFPIWISEPPLSDLVIAYCQAQPKDGGGGAWYVNLRVLS